MATSPVRILTICLAAIVGSLGLNTAAAHVGRRCAGDRHHHGSHVDGGGCCGDAGHFAIPDGTLSVPAIPRHAYVPTTKLSPVTPPPGTLGITYKRPSRLIPEKKHPRVGMLDVKGVPFDAVVSVRGLNGYRDIEGVWRFEPNLPLIPGIPHIYTVKIKTGDASGLLHADVRKVRLIPGRIVEIVYP
jgi:hypothetical protein